VYQLREHFLKAGGPWWLVLWFCFTIWLGSLPVRADPPPTAEFDIPYQLRVLATGTILEISGSFSWALPQTFQAALAAAPNVHVVRLESPGGHILPAMQIADIIHERGLDTFVGRFCASACTIAFLAGRQRWLGPDARLGFHQAHAPGFPSELVNWYLREAYRRLGMPAVFMAEALRAPPDGIWLPSRAELKAARLITDYSSATPSIGDDDWSRSLRDITQGAQVASGDAIAQLTVELSELLQRLQEADPQTCWIFTHDGLADLQVFLPQTLLDALQATHRRMAEEARSSPQPPPNAQTQAAIADRLSKLIRDEGHTAALEGLWPGADPSLFCPSLRSLLRIASQLPEAERIQTLRIILPRG
jgi:hypothetical protein